MGNYVFTADALIDAVTRDREREGSKHDMGGDIVPDFVSRGEAGVYDFKDNDVPGATDRDRGYWRDVGTVESYWQAHRDFLSEEPPIDLDERSWPIHTRGGRHSAARVLDDRQIENSLLSGGTRVSGDVRGSVLSPGVIVEKGATVVDSVLLPGVRVRAGATVTRAVLDDNVDVGERATVGGDGDITLVGRESRVEDGAQLPAGARMPEPERS